MGASCCKEDEPRKFAVAAAPKEQKKRPTHTMTRVSSNMARRETTVSVLDDGPPPPPRLKVLVTATSSAAAATATAVAPSPPRPLLMKLISTDSTTSGGGSFGFSLGYLSPGSSSPPISPPAATVSSLSVPISPSPRFPRGRFAKAASYSSSSSRNAALQSPRPLPVMSTSPSMGTAVLDGIRGEPVYPAIVTMSQLMEQQPRADTPTPRRRLSRSPSSPIPNTARGHRSSL